MSDAPSWVTLTDGEEVVWQSHPVIYHYLGGIVAGLVLLVLAAVFVVLSPLGGGLPPLVLAGVVALAGLVLVGRSLFHRSRTHYLITTEEVYVKRGFLSRTVTNVRMDRIQNTSFSQSFAGRLLSYGDVEIDTAGSGDTEMVLKHVGNPEDVLGHISEWMGQSGQPMAGRGD